MDGDLPEELEENTAFVAALRDIRGSQWVSSPILPQNSTRRPTHAAGDQTVSRVPKVQSGRMLCPGGYGRRLRR